MRHRAGGRGPRRAVHPARRRCEQAGAGLVEQSTLRVGDAKGFGVIQVSAHKRKGDGFIFDGVKNKSVPFSLFQLAPGAAEKTLPGQAVLAGEHQAFLGDGGAHGQVCPGRVDQIDSCFRHGQRFRQEAAQGFGAAKLLHPVEIAAPLQGNVPVTGACGRARGPTADQHGKFQVGFGGEQGAETGERVGVHAVVEQVGVKGYGPPSGPPQTLCCCSFYPMRRPTAKGKQ